jgi:hypothetical protein
MKSILFTLLLALLYQLAEAQPFEIIDLQSGTNIELEAGTTLHADNLELSPATNYTLLSPNTLFRDNVVANYLPRPYISRVYRFNNVVSGFNGAVAILYQDAELHPLNTENTLYLYVYDNGWSYYESPLDVPSITRDVANNVHTTFGIPAAAGNFRELTLANDNIILPLRWLDIQAVQSGGNNLVTWRTANEVNVKHFQLQKSRDGVTWINEGNTLPATNTPGTHSYSYTDRSRYSPITYYRVRQDDVDGRSSFSAIVSVKLSNQQSLMLLPNPATSYVKIISSAQPITSVVVYNAAGSMMYAKDRIQQNSMTIPVANWPAGYYSVQLIVNGERQVHKFIKQ